METRAAEGHTLTTTQRERHVFPTPFSGYAENRQSRIFFHSHHSSTINECFLYWPPVSTRGWEHIPEHVFWDSRCKDKLRNTCFQVSYVLDTEPSEQSSSTTEITYYSHPHLCKTISHTDFFRINHFAFAMNLDNSVHALVIAFILRFFTTRGPGCSKEKPTTSAAMAVHILKGTATLLVVIYLPLSTPSITTPQPGLPLILELPCQKPRTAFHLSVLFFMVNNSFALSFSSQVRPVISFLTGVP